MWFRSCIGNLNRKMRPLEFCWTGGVKIILTGPVISALDFYRAGSNNIGETGTSFHGNYVPFEIFRILVEKFISAVLHSLEIHMDGMILYAKIFIIIRP